MDMAIALQNAKDINDVVKVINNKTNDFLFTSEELAAQYAYNAAEEAGFTDKESIEYHLDYLIGQGAKFDFDEALNLIVAKK